MSQTRALIEPARPAADRSSDGGNEETNAGPEQAVRAPSPEASGIRPCMVSFYFHPDYSGSSVQAHNLSRHLQPLGAEPFVVAADLRGGPAFEIHEGVPVYRLPVSRPGELRVPSFWAALGRFLVHRRRFFDVIHSHGAGQHGAASLIGRLLGKPTIMKVTMADSDLAFARQGRIWGRINRFTASRYDRYIATTEAIAGEFRAQQLGVDRVRLIPNGVDTDKNHPLPLADRRRLRAALGLPGGPIVTYVGIINARKNVDGILRVWETAVRRGADGHLLLVGPIPEGSHAEPFYRDLRRFISEHGLADRVSFTGYTPDVTSYLQASDVLFFPSRQEGMPNAVLEAMACGLPCLTTESAGAETIVSHGVNGFAAAIDDENAMVRFVLELVSSEPLRARMGAAARQTAVSRFSLDTIARRYVDLYRELLGDSHIRHTLTGHPAAVPGALNESLSSSDTPTETRHGAAQ
jgi:glycosyltransferase involved in cell wall biosynthesis